MNKKSQLGIIGFVFMILVFLIVIAVLGGSLWSMWYDASASASLTGVEAFFYNNIVFFVFLFLILGIIGWVYWGSR